MEMPVKQHQSVHLGIFVIIATVFAMAFADAVVKWISSDFSLWQIYVVRSFIVIPILIVVPVASRQPIQLLRPQSFGWVSLRSLLLVLMYLAIYAGVPVLSLSTIAAALYTAPLFITILSVIFIDEPVGLKRWIGVLIGFIGVLIIIKPNSESFSFFVLIPIGAALFYAVAAIITGKKCADEKPIVLALALNIWLFLFGLVATFIIVWWQPSTSEVLIYPFLFGGWSKMYGVDWGYMFLLAALMLAISVGLAKAYQTDQPAVIATFDYSYLIFATIWGVVLFAEIPDLLTVIGLVLITVAGLVSIDY